MQTLFSTIPTLLVTMYIAKFNLPKTTVPKDSKDQSTQTEHVIILENEWTILK
jgi:hypothetical protein